MIENRVIVITGASDGIGAASARQLAGKGEHVVLVGRSPEKTRALADELGRPYYVADFADLSQVRELAGKLRHAYPRIDVLANNAGGIFAQENTADGLDKTLQVNHLAPFLLTHLLLDRLIASRAAVIQTASVGARIFGHIDLDDLGNARRWSANKAYGDAKLANILFTRELHRRFHGEGLSAVAFHPGNIASNFASETSSMMRFIYHTPLRRLLTSVDKGGEALTWLVGETSGARWRSGEYYENARIAKTNPQADDVDLAKRLWERSEELVGVRV